MTVSMIGVGFIIAGLLLGPIVVKLLFATIEIGTGWFIAHLFGYGTVYGVVVGLGFIGFVVVVEIGHRARHSR